eukprot:10457875-Lingulodinium_polyedra.AAC.1
MARSNRPSAATKPRASHASHTPNERQNWCSHGTQEASALRTAATADARFDRIIAHGFHNRAQ